MARIPRWTVVVSVLAILTGLGYSAEADSGDPELLKLVADMLEANLAQVQTWQGETAGKMTIIDTEGVVLSRTEHTNFALEMENELQRINWSATEDQERSDGALKKCADFFANELITKDRHYELSSDGYMSMGKTYPGLVVKSPEFAEKQAFARQFDPLKVVYPGSIPAFLRTLHNRKDKIKGLRVTRVGDTVIVEQPGEHPKATSSHWEFALNKGGNVTKLNTMSWGSDSESTVEYAKYGSAWVPEKVSIHSIPKAPGVNATSREVVFTSNRVNEPIGADQFSLEALGVTPNTRVSDNVLGLVYWFGRPPVSDDGAKLPEEAFSVKTSDKNISPASATSKTMEAIEQRNVVHPAITTQPLGKAHILRDPTVAPAKVIALVSGLLTIALLALRYVRVRASRKRDASNV